MSRLPLTELQRHSFARVVVLTAHGQWARALGSGERVTLASLCAKRLLVRRTWRGVEGERDAAHEYQAHPDVMQEVARRRAAETKGSP